MSVVQDSHDKNLSCTYKLPIPIGELLKSYRQQGLQDASDPASMSASSRRKDKSSETILYFCSLENFESAIVYLSQELQALGLGNLNLTTAGNHSGRTHDALATAFTGGVHRGTLLQLDLVCLVNRCWEVVQLYRSSVRDGYTLQEQHRRDANANTKLQASVSGLQEVRQEYDRKLQDAAEQKRQATEEARQLREALKLQKEDIRHLNVLLTQRDTQYKHDLRKRELECGKLRARLAHFVTDERKRFLETRGACCSGDGSSCEVEVRRWFRGVHVWCSESARMRWECSCPHRAVDWISDTHMLLRLMKRNEGEGPVERRLDMSSPLPSVPLQDDRTRAKWTSFSDSSRHTVEMYRRVLGQYECWLSGVSAERNMLAKCVETTASALQTLVKKHAKVLASEDLAASLTDSVYSMDSLDEPLTPTTAEGAEMQAAAGLHNLQQQIKDCLLAVSVVLAEKGAGDQREARLKRIHELAASAQPQVAKSSNTRLSTGQLGKRAVLPQSKDESMSSGNIGLSDKGQKDGGLSPGEKNLLRRDTPDGDHQSGVSSSNSAILQLVRHLGIVTATEGDESLPLPHHSAIKGDSTPVRLLTGSERTPISTRPSTGNTDTPTQNTRNHEEPVTSTPDLSPSHEPSSVSAVFSGASRAVTKDLCTPDVLSTDGAAQALERTTNDFQKESGGANKAESINNIGNKGKSVDSGIDGDGNYASDGGISPGLLKRNVPDSPASEAIDQSWLRVCGGPDDSTASEVMTLKKLLEEERLEVKREKERYAEAAIRLNRERAAFEQDKVQLLRQQFLDDMRNDADMPTDHSCLSLGDASFYQVSPVPAWLGRHHHRPFSPSPDPPQPICTSDRVQKASKQQQPHQKPDHQQQGRHNHLSVPSTPSRLTSVPNITPPPPLEWEFRARSRPFVLTRAKSGKNRNNSGGSCDSGRSRQCTVSTSGTSGRRSAPVTRAPSACRSHGDSCSERSCTVRQVGAELNGAQTTSNGRFSFTLGGKKSRSPSVGLSNSSKSRRVASSSSRLSSQSRDSSLHRHSSKGGESSATSSSNTRDSSISRVSSKNRESSVNKRSNISKNSGSTSSMVDHSSIRYHTLPRSYKVALKSSSNGNKQLERTDVQAVGNLNETSRSGINWAGDDGNWIITRGSALVSRSSMDAAKYREQVRRSMATKGQNTETPTSHSRGRRQCPLYNSKSLPRNFNKSPPPNSFNSDEGCLDPSSSYGVDIEGDHTTKTSGEISVSLRNKDDNMRPKSSSFSQAVDVNGMYASLPPELLSKIDSREVLPKNSVLLDKLSASCSGACKEFLKVPSDAACLCHLLRQKPISSERESSDFSLPGSSNASDFDNFESVSQAELQHDFKTHQRIDAIESSLLNLISKIASSDKNCVDSSALPYKDREAQVDAALYRRDPDQGLQTSMSSNEFERTNASMVSAPPSSSDCASRRNSRPQLSISSSRILTREKQGLARAEPVEDLPAESERILQARNLLSSLRFSAKLGSRPRQESSSSHANSD